jgi:hypothetical protein
MRLVYEEACTMARRLGGGSLEARLDEGGSRVVVARSDALGVRGCRLRLQRLLRRLEALVTRETIRRLVGGCRRLVGAVDALPLARREDELANSLVRGRLISSIDRDKG